LQLTPSKPQVALIYTSSKDAESTAASISSSTNTKCVAYQSDVRDPAAIEKTIKQIASDFGRLDIVVANAGIANHYAAEDYTPEQYSEIMKVNLDGAFYTAQAAGRIFKEAGKGNLIFTASVSAILVNVPQKQAAVRLYIHWKLSTSVWRVHLYLVADAVLV
jgi:sorbose reductase